MIEPPYKVLFVDDNRIIRHLLRLTFADAGSYQIFEAGSYEEALPIIKQDHPSLIVLDVMMPGKLNGLELCKLIKSSHEYHYCKIIILSARTQQDDIELGINAGADLYVTKPFSPVKLIQIVEQLRNPS